MEEIVSPIYIYIYIQFASDLQDILIRELYDLKPVSESEIDCLFDEIACITNLYIKAGPADDLSERWIKSAALRNLPKEFVKNIAGDFKQADNIEDVQSLITIYLHDPLTGLARGQPGPLICLTSQDSNDQLAEADVAAPDKAEAQHADKHGTTTAQPKQDTDLNVATNRDLQFGPVASPLLMSIQRTDMRVLPVFLLHSVMGTLS